MMGPPYRIASVIGCRPVAIAAALLMIVPLLSSTVTAEIPHENYDFVTTDIQIVVDLLNLSINYTERSLVSLIHEQTDYGSANLSTVLGLLTPAEQLLGQIADVADSYGNLSELLPPFVAFADEEGRVIPMEETLLSARAVILTLSGHAVLTQEEAIQAMVAINEATAAISGMNESIDVMIGYARDITAISVAEETPFEDNQLEELLELLRQLLYMIELELADLIHGEPGTEPWAEVEPFLTLWLADTDLYLGEVISGGGYLFFDGAFQADWDVYLYIDGEPLLISITGAIGNYAFSYRMSISERWLGSHEALALAETPNGTLESPPIEFVVRLIPTTLSLTVSPTLLAPAERVTVTGRLTDVWGMAVPEGACNLSVDDDNYSFTTDQTGAFKWSALGSDFAFGAHSANASYSGELPYKSARSPVKGFTVNVPTWIELVVLNDRVLLGNYLLAAGTLYANDSEPLDGWDVAISVDGERVDNITTGSAGTFSLSLDTSDMVSGGHVLKAEFLNHTVEYRYSANSSAFTVYQRKLSDYPFWPIIPGWGELGPIDTIPDLFFGRTGYLAWLLVVALVVAAVKTIQRRSAAKAKREAEALQATAARTSQFPSEEWVPEAELVEAPRAGRPPKDPNARVVWTYNNLLQFLIRDRRVTISDNMTHWEIARFLKTLGYPVRAVERLTQLFEKAFYAGSMISQDEVQHMNDLSEEIKSAERKVGPIAT